MHAKKTIREHVQTIGRVIASPFRRKKVSEQPPIPLPPPTPEPVRSVWEAVDRAVDDQRAFEVTHPVEYAPDQRYAALLTRTTNYYGAPLPAGGSKLVAAAAAVWDEPAKETP
jgi:hypothetical protein